MRTAIVVGVDKFCALACLIRKRMDFQDLYSDLHHSMSSKSTMTIPHHSLIGLHSESPNLATFWPSGKTRIVFELSGFMQTTHRLKNCAQREESNGAIGSSSIATGTIFSDVKVGECVQRCVTAHGVRVRGTGLKNTGTFNYRTCTVLRTARMK